MCIGCGGTCTAPRFTSNPTGVRPVVVGTAAGPDLVPVHIIRQNGRLATFEGLYTGLDPSGEPSVAVLPGSFGMGATRAGRR